MKRIFMTMALAILMVAATFGAAFSAPGDVGLGDFGTDGSVRPNTYDADYNVGDYFELQIIKYVEIPSGDVVPQFFSSAAEADPGNFSWAQVSTTTGDSDIDIGTGEARELTPGNWYYYVIGYGYGQVVGPESWEATYSYSSTVASGDFTFVTTDFSAEDIGTTPLVDIEFYDGDPTDFANLIVSGDFEFVYASEDHAWSPAHSRSYATVLDAVAHGVSLDQTPPSERIILGYDKYPGQQYLISITDLNGMPYPYTPPKTGWMYGVYYTENGQNYTYDPDSFYIGPDDYKFKDDDVRKYPALVIWGLGDLTQYKNYFPQNIDR